MSKLQEKEQQRKKIALQKLLDANKSKFEKLPVKFKKQWVAALRSGKYIQGKKGYLRSKDYIDLTNDQQITHCCLGVACSVVGATGILDKCYISNEEGAGNSRIRNITRIPEQLRGEYKLPRFLAQINDNQASTFEIIADWIEENL